MHILTAAMLIAAAVFPGPAQAEKRVALVIGNDRYANLPADKQLLKAVKDAEAVGDALATLGFTVIRGQNLGRQGIIDKLSAFTAQLQPADTAAFFYAGHGVAIGGVNYLVPSDVPAVTPDAEARVRGNSIAEGDIVGEIQAKGARVAVLVIDACRDNPFPRSGTRSIGNTRGLADAKPARGVFTIYSAGIGQTALDRLEKNDPNPNSVFTRVFVQQLAHADRRLVDMVVEMREQVAELALKAKDDAGRPEPHEQTPAYYDQTIGGHVYLASTVTQRAPAMPSPLDREAMFWDSIKGNQNEADFLAYLKQFPEGLFARLARNRLALLHPPDEAPKPEPPAISPEELTRNLQTELKRVGCYSGPVDGVWGAGAQAAIQQFNQRTSKALNTQIVSLDSVTAVKAHTDRVCLALPSAKRPQPGQATSRAHQAPAAPPKTGGDCFTFNGQQVCN